MKLEILGRIPSKKNSKRSLCLAKNKSIIFYSPQYKQWEKETIEKLNEYRPDKLIETCSINMTFFFPDNRKSDLINKAESVLDILVSSSFIKDDDWKCVSSLHLFSGAVDKENPRVEIEIIDISSI